MTLPEVPEVARLLLSRLGPKALATLESMLDDPKLSAKDRLDVIRLIMNRYYREPKINASAGRSNTVVLTSSTEVNALMSRAQQRIATKPTMIEAEPGPEPEDDE